MMRLSVVALALAASLMPFAPAPAARADAIGGTAGDGAGHNMAYRLYRPAGHDAPGAADLPLVVFLHGVGERGTNASNLSSTTITSHVGGLVSATQGSAHPAYLLMPQVPNANTPGFNTTDPSPQFVNVPFSTGSYSTAPAQSTWMGITLSLIEQTIAANNVDPGRVYITGLSMGGYGAWDALARRPDLFAAGVPMSGGGNTSAGGAIKGIPTWTFHGSADSTVPVSGSRDMVNALMAAGGSPLYNELAGQGHVIWQPLYDDLASSATGGNLYEWMFSQSVPEPTAAATLAVAAAGLLLRRRRGGERPS